MKLIGMLDSPYVRRVAISLQLLGLRFEHQSLSVFRTFEEFQHINPVVKAPTFITDDGMILMDSTLILEYAERIARPRTLMPADDSELAAALRIISLAMAAADKSVQFYYERDLRPPEKHHEVWLQRIKNQIVAAYAELESELTRKSLLAQDGAIDQAGVSAAVAWHFTQRTVPDAVESGRFPHLVALSEHAETLAEFRAAPHGDATYPYEARADHEAQR